MANIKISELEEYTQAKDNDLLVIVDTTNNETKKIENFNLSKNKLDKTSIKNIKTNSDENIYSCNYVNTAIGSLDDLKTIDKSSVVNSINEIDNRFTYSTNEQIIGKWINGKPLYKKVVLFNDTINANELLTKSHEINNADVVFIKNAYLYVLDTGLCYPLNQIGYNGNLTEKYYCWSDRTSIYIYGNGGVNQNWGKLFILEYTKTTD